MYSPCASLKMFFFRSTIVSDPSKFHCPREREVYES
jgi:hypothetical protein